MKSDQIRKFLDYLEFYKLNYYDTDDRDVHGNTNEIIRQMTIELADTLEREAKEIRSQLAGK